MPDFVLSFEVFCSCGNGLCSVSRVSYNRGYPQLEVEPCEKCLEEAKDKGFDEGYNKALEDHPQE